WSTPGRATSGSSATPSSGVSSCSKPARRSIPPCPKGCSKPAPGRSPKSRRSRSGTPSPTPAATRGRRPSSSASAGRRCGRSGGGSEFLENGDRRWRAFAVGQPGLPEADLFQQMLDVEPQSGGGVGLQAAAGFGEGAARAFDAVEVEGLMQGGGGLDQPL